MPTYTIRKLRTLPTRDGEAWSCEILKDGVLIGTAENDGDGGCNMYDFTNRADQAAMEAHAKATLGDEIEVLDEFVVNLTVTFEMNRMRTVAFILDGDDFDNMGQFRQVQVRSHRRDGPGATAEQPGHPGQAPEDLGQDGQRVRPGRLTRRPRQKG